MGFFFFFFKVVGHTKAFHICQGFSETGQPRERASSLFKADWSHLPSTYTLLVLF